MAPDYSMSVSALRKDSKHTRLRTSSVGPQTSGSAYRLPSKLCATPDFYLFRSMCEVGCEVEVEMKAEA